MAVFAFMARYRYAEGHESRSASFYGLSCERSDTAVLGRLKEVHRFAAWVEVVEVRWRGAGAGTGGSAETA